MPDTPDLAALQQALMMQPGPQEQQSSTVNSQIQPTPQSQADPSAGIQPAVMAEIKSQQAQQGQGPPQPGMRPNFMNLIDAISGKGEVGQQASPLSRPVSRSDEFHQFVGNFLQSFAAGMAGGGTGPGANMRGAGIAMQAPYQRELQQYQLRQQQQQLESERQLKESQARNLDAQSQLTQTPWGPMPAKFAAAMMGQYVKGGQAADTAAESREKVANINAAAKVGAMSPFGKLSPEMAAVGMPPDWKDTAKYPGGLKDPKFLADVQNYGAQVSGLKQRNAMQLARARGESFAFNRAKYTQVAVLDKDSQTPTFATPLDIAKNSDRYAPLNEGDKIMMKNAVFEDIKGAASNLRSAVMANPTGFSAGQIAKMTAAMRDDPSGALLGSTIQNLTTAGAKDAMNPQQRAQAIAINQAYENAYALRSVAGFGQGSDQLREAIRATLPGPSSPPAYALQQLTAFDQQVDRLLRGVPNMPLRPAAGGSKPKGPISADEAQEYLRKAGGNKDMARKMAKADGRSF